MRDTHAPITPSDPRQGPSRSGAGGPCRGPNHGASAIEHALYLAALLAVLASVVLVLGPAMRGAFDKGCAITDSKTTTCPTERTP